MRVLLINPPIREWAKPNCFPLGLGYLSSVLLKSGHELEILDINACRYSQKEVEKRIKITEYDLAGIGGIITTYRYVKWLISILKKYHPHQNIIVGGSLGSSIPQLMLERNEVDIVCIGEGEATIKELVNFIEDGRDLSLVQGIWFKDETGSIHANKNREPIRNLDDLPLPSWDCFPLDIYLNNPVGAPNRNKWTDGASTNDMPLSMNLSGSRGCPYKCTFCYHDFMGQGYRHRSAQNIIEEIRILHSNYGIKYFHFIDDTFVMSRRFVYQFCQEINNLRRQLGSNITWGCNGRVNLMTEDLIAAMANAGCISIGYGIESGSQKMLDIMRKEATVEQAKEAVKLTQEYLGWADCSFMIGLPGETRETIQETVDFCKELNLAPEVIFFATPYPNTELYRLALQLGRIKDEETYIQQLGEQGEVISVNFTNFSDEELYRIKESIVEKLGAWNKIKHG